MGGYIARRVFTMAWMLVLLSIIVFVLFNAVPADPAALTCGKACNEQVIEANRERLGLDKPLTEQYVDWVQGIFVGRTYGSGDATFECSAPCLGYSFLKREEVTDLLVERFPVTASIAVGAVVLWLGLGVSSGILAALRRGQWQDKTVTAVAMFFYSFPTFFIGLVLLFFVVIRWGLLPYPSWVPLTEDPWRWFQTMLLPWFTIALISAGFYTRLTRSQMLETLGEDYIRTARSKGLPERTVIRKHGLRAGLTPIVTATGLDLAFLLGGAIVAESIFTLPGIGKLFLDSATTLDLPVLAATTLVAGAFVLVANLVVDLLYGVIDPRVRLA
jgi:peptide/nickel transport system permease protein